MNQKTHLMQHFLLLYGYWLRLLFKKKIMVVFDLEERNERNGMLVSMLMGTLQLKLTLI